MRNPFRSDPPSLPPQPAPPAEPSAGGQAALDHIAAWVRFADGKATLLAAGLAATLALLGGRLDAITDALHKPCPANIITGVVGAFTLLATAWTLFWLVAAINPRNIVTHPGLNRFAWPTMARTTITEIQIHAAENDADQDAWKEAIDLAKIAERKFGNTKLAGYGFAAALALSVGLVVYTAVITA